MKALKSVFAVAIAMLLAVATVGTQAATTYQGVDVSKWQPNYDFAEAKRDGVKVVFLRSSLADTVQDVF
ncbi:MAG TPA: hypothetical protein DG942_02135 [Ruminococcaceae bacterium]|jgi:GH25 family lysozyme M1 (1,4-beta-N-acetylmuramidase)|nr:hypothetical protein [Oscillospiraceae bacterium]